MSGVFKSVGKVFKKVVKVAKKVAIPALIVGAVVLTGGAAIGALPAMGTMLASVGVTGTMAGVLGGAISSAAVGAVTSGAMAGVQGKNVWSAAKSGALVGAVTGGVLGGAGVISPNGVLSDMGVGSQRSALQGLVDAKVANPAQIAKLAQLKGASPGMGNGSTAGAVTPVGTSNNAIPTVDPNNASALAPGAGPGRPSLLPSSVGEAINGAGPNIGYQDTGLNAALRSGGGAVKAGGGLLQAATAAAPIIGGGLKAVGGAMVAKAQADDAALGELSKQVNIGANYGLLAKFGNTDANGNPTKRSFITGFDQMGSMMPPLTQPQPFQYASAAPQPYFAIENGVVVRKGG